jgi:hypothetical protein
LRRELDELRDAIAELGSSPDALHASELSDGRASRAS